MWCFVADRDMEGTVWNEAEIDRRSRQLATYVITIWPHADVLRRELGIAPPEQNNPNIVSGIAPATARRLVDTITSSGIEGRWISIEGLNRTRRGDRYGRYLRIGGGDQSHGAWFGVSEDHQELVLDFWTPTSASGTLRAISLPDGDFFEMLQTATEQVHDIARSISPSD